MSAPHDDDDFAPTSTAGYNPGQQKTLEEYAQLDAHDESLNAWKKSLGLSATDEAAAGPKLTIIELFLTSASLPAGKKIAFDLSDVDHSSKTFKQAVTIKEGVEYSVGARFRVNHGIVSALQYIQVAKRAGIKVDTIKAMLGSYGAKGGEVIEKIFHTEESPSGMLARSGSYLVESRFVDDDYNPKDSSSKPHATFTWSFKLAKEWE